MKKEILYWSLIHSNVQWNLHLMDPLLRSNGKPQCSAKGPDQDLPQNIWSGTPTEFIKLIHMFLMFLNINVRTNAGIKSLPQQ